MAKGIIARLMDRGFGFIKAEEGGDLFFHSTSIEGVEFNNLREGQEVEFEKGQGRDGRPAAVTVRLTEIHGADASSDFEDNDEDESEDDEDEEED